MFVAGGYGVAPLSFLAQRGVVRGVVPDRGADGTRYLCVEDFGGFGWEARVATEDGTRGERGRVTALVDAWVAEQGATGAAGRPVLYACGPEGLMKVLAARTAAWGWQAWLSLDRPMGCGVGACLGLRAARARRKRAGKLGALLHGGAGVRCARAGVGAGEAGGIAHG